MAQGYVRRQQQAERQELAAWQRTRWLGTVLRNVNRGDNPAISPEEMLPLPGDGPLATGAMSEEEFARIAALD